MIIKNIKLFSQNIQRNKFLTNIILETNYNFNIIFIQELAWSIIWAIPSLTSKEGDRVVGTPCYEILWTLTIFPFFNLISLILY